MNPPRPQSPALFNRYERALIAIVVTTLMIIVISTMSDFHAPYIVVTDDLGNYVESRPAMIERVLRFAHEKWETAIHLAGIYGFMLMLATPFVTFVTARRNPRRILVGMFLLTLVYLLAIACYTPGWAAVWIDEFRPWSEAAIYFGRIIGGPRFYGGANIEESFAPYVLLLLLVCCIGEFAYLVAQRELRNRCLAQVEGSEAEKRALHRERLVLAALGAPMPVPLAVGRCLSLLVIPPIAVMAIGGMTERFQWFELELPAPPLASVLSSRRTALQLPQIGSLDKSSRVDAKSSLRIESSGQVYLDGRKVGTPSDKQLEELRDRLKKIAPLLTAPISLQVDSAARHERLVDVLSAVGNVGVSVVLAD